MDIVYNQENWSTTHRIVYFIRNENHLKLKPFRMRLGHFTTPYFICCWIQYFWIRFCCSASLKTHISVSLTNQFGILSIPVTWYNRAMAQFERSNIPALIFIIRSQSELNSEFFCFDSGGFLISLSWWSHLLVQFMQMRHKVHTCSEL